MEKEVSTKEGTSIKDNGRIKNLGVDLGNDQIKTSEKVLIPSLISIGWNVLDEDENICRVEFEGLKYTIGKGESRIYDSKYFDKYYKIMLLTAIACSLSESILNINLTIGLPIALYKNKEQVERIRTCIQNYGTNTITVNYKGEKKEKTITINKLNIWIESGILFYDYNKYSKEKFICVDIGGYSIDVLVMDNGRIAGSYNLTTGIQTLVSTIQEQVNQEYNADIRSGANILKNLMGGKEFLINGKSINMKFIDSIVEIYFQGIFSELNKRISLNEYKIRFIGGGANIFERYISSFESSYDIEVLGDSDFINSYTYLNVSKAN